MKKKECYREPELLQLQKSRTNIRPDRESGGQFRLDAVYPDPFLSVGSFTFSLFNGCYVRLELYNRRGRLVCPLAEGLLAAGDYKLILAKEDAGLASGSYMYQLQAENVHGSFRKRRRLHIL